MRHDYFRNCCDIIWDSETNERKKSPSTHVPQTGTHQNGPNAHICISVISVCRSSKQHSYVKWNNMLKLHRFTYFSCENIKERKKTTELISRPSLFIDCVRIVTAKLYPLIHTNNWLMRLEMCRKLPSGLTIILSISWKISLSKIAVDLKIATRTRNGATVSGRIWEKKIYCDWSVCSVF